MTAPTTTGPGCSSATRSKASSRSPTTRASRALAISCAATSFDELPQLVNVLRGQESTDSWAAVLRDLKTRGLNEPKLVTGDGALSAWAALRDVFPAATEQRCWVHKSANVLDAMPKRLQPRAKSLLHEMAEAPTAADARAARERFRSEFDAKYPNATAKLDRDWDALTAFSRSPPSTGASSGRPTRSRAASRPSGCAPR